MSLLCLFGHQKHYKAIVRMISPSYGHGERMTCLWEARWICGRNGCHGFGATMRDGGHWKIVDNKIVPDRQKWADGETW